MKHRIRTYVEVRENFVATWKCYDEEVTSVSSIHLSKFSRYNYTFLYILEASKFKRVETFPNIFFVCL